MLVLILFCIELLISILLDISIVIPLLIGLVMFILYGRYKGLSWRELWELILAGVRTTKGVLTVFLLIGILTGVWRACGTIPYIICAAVDLIRPGTIVLMSFLLNCGVSLLIGTAFGTAATMGTICMTVAASMGVNPIIAGGAIVSGVYFGDRCSPVSSSALLVSGLTGTDLYSNIRRMFRTAIVPFVISCAVYACIGLMFRGGGERPELWSLFGSEIALHWIVLIPAVAVLIPAAFRVNVKWAMTASIASALVLCFVFQKLGVSEVLRCMIFGFTAKSDEVGSMLNGGGLVSMLRSAAIILISSSYAGIFRKTGLLDTVKAKLTALAERTAPVTAMALTAILTCMVACNQVLTVMLTHELCGETEPDRETEAIDIENTAIVISPLIPWSISCTVVVSSISAPWYCIAAAVFLYLIPICSIIAGKIKKNR